MRLGRRRYRPQPRSIRDRQRNFHHGSKGGRMVSRRLRQKSGPNPHPFKCSSTVRRSDGV